MLNYHQKIPQYFASYRFEAIAALERVICTDLQESSAGSPIGKEFQEN